MKLNKKWIVGMLCLSVLLLNAIPSNSSNTNYSIAKEIKFNKNHTTGKTISNEVALLVAIAPYVTSESVSLMAGRPTLKREVNYSYNKKKIEEYIKIDKQNLD